MNVWSQKKWSKVLFCSSFLINHHATDHRFWEEVSGRVCARHSFLRYMLSDSSERILMESLEGKGRGKAARPGAQRWPPYWNLGTLVPTQLWVTSTGCEPWPLTLNWNNVKMYLTVKRMEKDPSPFRIQGNNFPQNFSSHSVWIRLPDRQQIQHSDNHKPGQLNANYGVKLLEDLSAVHFVYVTFLECVRLEWLMS